MYTQLKIYDFQFIKIAQVMVKALTFPPTG